MFLNLVTLPKSKNTSIQHLAQFFALNNSESSFNKLSKRNVLSIYLHYNIISLEWLLLQFYTSTL